MANAIVIDEFDSTVTVEHDVRFLQSTLQIIKVDLKRAYEARLGGDADYQLYLSLSPRTETRMMLGGASARNPSRRAGNLFLVPAEQAVQTRSGPGVDLNFICRLSKSIFSQLTEDEQRWTDELLEAGFDISGGPIPQLMRRLADELLCPGFASSLLVEAITTELAVELVRYRAHFREATHSGLAPWRLRRIDDMLAADAATSLAELAASCGLSIRQLSRGFRECRGISLGRFVADLRLAEAKRRLAEGASIKRVAHAAGFASPAAFCQSFRKSTGITPGQYRDGVLAARRH